MFDVLAVGCMCRRRFLTRKPGARGLFEARARSWRGSSRVRSTGRYNSTRRVGAGTTRTCLRNRLSKTGGGGHGRGRS